MEYISEGIGIRIPKKVFFSNDPIHYTVKNDFYFTIFKATPSNTVNEVKRNGEKYSTIYIKGFEQLFKDDATKFNQLDLFFKMFHTNGNNDWSIRYDRFRDTDDYCAVITTSADSLQNDFSVGLQLSDKCAFTKIPDTASPITLEVYIDDFDIYFSELSDRIEYRITLERGFAVYIEQFGAYSMQDPNTKLVAVHKGDSCYISWKIEQNEKASAFLYDENGAVIANLPPYTAKIDKDKRFTLVAYNDFCSVNQSLVIYRTLWQKKGTLSLDNLPTDQKGRFKFYKRNENYYLYIHPKIYTSKDFKTWSVYCENTVAPVNYKFYSSNFTENKVSICYLSDDVFTYCEMNFSDSEWKKSEINRAVTFAYALYPASNKTIIALSLGDDIGLFELKGQDLINGSFLRMDARVTAMDVLSDNGHTYLAVLTEDKRAYFYDLEDDFKNNIFECQEIIGDHLHLVKSNAIYIVLNGAVLEVSDREKFADLHFFPKFKMGTHPIIGGDNETIVGVFQTEETTDIWEYKF